MDALRPLLARHGIRLHVVDPVDQRRARGLVHQDREFLLEGNVEAAALLLTRPYDLDGGWRAAQGAGVASGSRRRTSRPVALLPANGVYAVRAGRRLGPEARAGRSTEAWATSA